MKPHLAPPRIPPIAEHAARPLQHHVRDDLPGHLVDLGWRPGYEASVLQQREPLAVVAEAMKRDTRRGDDQNALRHASYSRWTVEVVKITPRGYCHGVVKAINIAREQGRSADGLIYALGQLVHNRHVLDDLRSHGVELIDGQDRFEILEKIDQGTVIFSAHGVSPRVRERATEKGLRWIDATCPDVIRTHDLAKDKAAAGYHIVYIGKHGHPEPEGVVGEVAPGQITLVETSEEIEQLDIRAEKIAVLTQTTISVWDTDALVERILARYPQAEVHNEICRATQDRQEAAVEAARDCDAVIVVGDRRSSNSKRLVDVVRDRAGKPAYLVDNVAEIDPAWLIGIRRVGVTSGASTPSEVTRAVIQHLEALPAQVA